MIPNVFEIGRQSDGFQGFTIIESITLNACDGVRYSDPHKAITTIESHVLDGSNGGMKDDLRGIFRGFFMIETVISVDGRCEIWNVLSWQVNTQIETTIPTFIVIIFNNPGDCEDPSVDRESETIPNLVAGNDPGVDYQACGSCRTIMLLRLSTTSTIIMIAIATVVSCVPVPARRLAYVALKKRQVVSGKSCGYATVICPVQELRYRGKGR